MTKPDNLSLKGIIDWAEGNSGPQVDPPNNQNINADRVDGMHASDIIAAATAAGGGGVVATGTNTFAGNGSGRLIDASQGMVALPNTQYQVTITPEADTDSRVGEIWVGNKTVNSFYVYNEGSGQTSFRWAVSVKGQMPDLAGPASGDISGNHPGPYTVDKIKGRAVSSNSPNTGDTLVWNGSMWVPQAPASSGSTVNYGTGSGLYVASWGGNKFVAANFRWYYQTSSGYTYKDGPYAGDMSDMVPGNVYLARIDGASFVCNRMALAVWTSPLHSSQVSVGGYSFHGVQIFPQDNIWA